MQFIVNIDRCDRTVSGYNKSQIGINEPYGILYPFW